MLTLLEIHKECPEILNKLEIYVDGGIRRGTDVLKALALGATAVGIGRPYLYSLAYGQEGVQHLTESMSSSPFTNTPEIEDYWLTSSKVLKDELISTMKLSGITDVNQAHPGMVNTSKLEHLIRTGGEKHPWIKWEPRARL
jgi:L-lactate dehydrogenase (cytochrome)